MKRWTAVGLLVLMFVSLASPAFAGAVVELYPKGTVSGTLALSDLTAHNASMATYMAKKGLTAQTVTLRDVSNMTGRSVGQTAIEASIVKQRLTGAGGTRLLKGSSGGLTVGAAGANLLVMGAALGLQYLSDEALGQVELYDASGNPVSRSDVTHWGETYCYYGDSWLFGEASWDPELDWLFLGGTVEVPGEGYEFTAPYLSGAPYQPSAFLGRVAMTWPPTVNALGWTNACSDVAADVLSCYVQPDTWPFRANTAGFEGQTYGSLYGLYNVVTGASFNTTHRALRVESRLTPATTLALTATTSDAGKLNTDAESIRAWLDAQTAQMLLDGLITPTALPHELASPGPVAAPSTDALPAFAGFPDLPLGADTPVADFIEGVGVPAPGVAPAPLTDGKPTTLGRETWKEGVGGSLYRLRSTAAHRWPFAAGSLVQQLVPVEGTVDVLNLTVPLTIPGVGVIEVPFAPGLTALKPYRWVLTGCAALTMVGALWSLLKPEVHV